MKIQCLEVFPLSRYRAEKYHGQATDLERLENAAAMPKDETPKVETPENTTPQNLGRLVQDAYRSTERPFEPSNTRLSATDAPFLAQDADMILQAMYRVLPSKEIAALLRNL